MQEEFATLSCGDSLDIDVSGTVVHGFGRGHSLLSFETANIDFESTIFTARDFGVYCGYVQLRGEPLRLGVISIGKNPTFDNAYPTFEVHILDFKRDIYGEEMRVRLVRKLRDMIEFKSVADLIAQIARDIDAARRILSARPPAQAP